MPLPRRPGMCRDRTCGSEDCPTCHPEHFSEEGEYLGDRKCVNCGAGWCERKDHNEDWICDDCHRLIEDDD